MMNETKRDLNAEELENLSLEDFLAYCAARQTPRDDADWAAQVRRENARVTRSTHAVERRVARNRR